MKQIIITAETMHAIMTAAAKGKKPNKDHNACSEETIVYTKDGRTVNAAFTDGFSAIYTTCEPTKPLDEPYAAAIPSNFKLTPKSKTEDWLPVYIEETPEGRVKITECAPERETVCEKTRLSYTGNQSIDGGIYDTNFMKAKCERGDGSETEILVDRQRLADTLSRMTCNVIKLSVPDDKRLPVIITAKNGLPENVISQKAFVLPVYGRVDRGIDTAEEILSFIDGFRENGQAVIEMFAGKQSYWFANILLRRFAKYQPEIWYVYYDGDHFIVKICDLYYDINGVYDTTDRHIVSWSNFKKDEPEESERIIQNCIL